MFANKSLLLNCDCCIYQYLKPFNCVQTNKLRLISKCVYKSYMYEQDLTLNNLPWLIPVQISLTLSRHFSLSFIASDRFSGQHPVSSHSCCMYVRAGRPAFARPYVGVHRSTSLMSLFLLLQLCPVCLVRLTWIVFVMGSRWPYN